MAMTQDFIAVGVFHDSEQARHAIDELKRAGYSENEIGFLARASATGSEDDTMRSAATGAVEGGTIGGVLGAVAALLIPGFRPCYRRRYSAGNIWRGWHWCFGWQYHRHFGQHRRAGRGGSPLPA